MTERIERRALLVRAVALIGGTALLGNRMGCCRRPTPLPVAPKHCCRGDEETGGGFLIPEKHVAEVVDELHMKPPNDWLLVDTSSGAVRVTLS